MPPEKAMVSPRFDARPDTVDFRDRMYEATMVEVPTCIPLADYLAYRVPVLNQGNQGACVGFGLATVAHFLLRRRRVVPDPTPVSARMLYEIARRYDEWPGENYQGSSARGAMKGWHKHGVCSEALWPFAGEDSEQILTYERASDAMRRPLGAYLRVNHRDLVAMHSALAEVGILFATAWIHPGWLRADKKGVIPYDRSLGVLGGHAFALVAYDENGFWVQNSWGAGWGRQGLAQVSYDDWLAHGLDVWVARLGVPVQLRGVESAAAAIAPGATLSKSYSFSDLRPHLVSLGEGGALSATGTFSTSEADLEEIFRRDIPRLMQGWERPRLLVYAPGGLVGSAVLLQRVAEYRAAMLEAQVYPLVFHWNSDLWLRITDVLQAALRQRRPEGSLSGELDFMLDRLDDTLEPLARNLTGRAQWAQLKVDAWQSALEPQGGVRLALKHLAEWVAGQPQAEIHLLAHSVGSIFLAPFARLLTEKGRIRSGSLRGLTGYNLSAQTCTLWAPAISLEDFKQMYLPPLSTGRIQRLRLYTLSERAERKDHCANIYHKSLLYLIANAFEDRRPTPLLGLEADFTQDPEMVALHRARAIEWVQAPSSAPPDSPWASGARRHADFDDDELTLRSTLLRILDSRADLPGFDFKRSEASLREQRAQVQKMTE